MNGPLLFATTAAAAGITGYTVGRTRPGPRLINWAVDQVAMRTVRSPRFWVAVPIVLVAVAAVWTLHPRRSADNRRSWRAEPVPPPIPRLDPDWAARRTAEDSDPLHPSRESESHR